MKTQLLPHYCKKIGLAIFAVAFAPSVVAGFVDGWSLKEYALLSKETIHVLDIIGIIGIGMYALSKDRVYDELLQRLRLEAIKLTFVISMLIVTLVLIIWPDYRIHPSYLINLQVFCFIGVYYFKKENFGAAVAPEHIHE